MTQKQFIEKEIECSECGKISLPDYSKWGKGSIPDLCDECLKKGWTEITPENAIHAFKDDPILSKTVLTNSPYYD